MAVTDPYSVLGVARSASRAEIARAYRALAKQHHPDAGAAPSPTMARINEAWHLLSDPSRRARWDRDHPVVAGPPPWTQEPMRPQDGIRVRPMPRRRAPEAPRSRMDSPWLAAGVVAVVAVLVGGLMLLVASVSAPPNERARFEAGGLRFAYPDRWTMASGVNGQPAGHRIVAHLLTFSAPADELCTDFRQSCPWTDTGGLPTGTASVLITAWQGGTPPVEQPVVRRPYGLHADAMIGGQPAAVVVEPLEAGRVLVWWQLSGRDFPARWYEVHAHLRGGPVEQDRLRADIEAVLDSLEFTE